MVVNYCEMWRDRFNLSEECKIFFSKINKKYRIGGSQMDSLVTEVRKD